MITEARRKASRRNGRRSRGPKTPEGRARSSRNAVRHGLSRPAGLDPAFADWTAALARAIAGPQAGRERFEMACRIACAQVDVWRVRRARADCLAVDPLDDATLDRAVALDRYEARALSRRKRAIWAFDAASRVASDADDRDLASPAALEDIALRRSCAHAVGRYRYRTGFPRLPDPYAEANKEARRIARLFGHTRRNDREYFGLRNPARSGRLTTVRPNEPEAAASRLRDFSQTNPTRPAAKIPPNEPEAIQSGELHSGQTNPSLSHAGNASLTERTEAEGNRARPMAATPWQRARAILGKRTRAAAKRRELLA